jgi:aspartate aminotransferase-like enzyme
LNLRMPGPTPCRQEVLSAVAHPMMNHRGPEMKKLLEGLNDKMRRYLATTHDVLWLTASGTGGLEAAVSNLMSPGDPVLGVSAGVFGERFCQIAAAYGADLKRIEVEWGRAIEPDTLRAAIKRTHNLKAVLLTHNETSTGVAHPIEALCRVVSEEKPETLLLVDAVSSLGAMPLPMDEIGIDVVVTGSQKAWGVPPGMTMLCLSSRAWEAVESASMPRFYFDLRKYRDAQVTGSFPFTPVLPVLFGLDAALTLMLEETPEAVHARHRIVAARAREGLEKLGLQLFADERFLSPTVTAFRLPRGIDEAALVELLRSKYETVFARGQQRLRGEILRLGHLGWVQLPDIDAATDALRDALAEMGSTTGSTGA